MSRDDDFINEILFDGSQYVNAAPSPYEVDPSHNEFENAFESAFGHGGDQAFEYESYFESTPYNLYADLSAGGAGSGILSESELEDLAYDLMAIQSEAELEEFLGDLFKKISKNVSAAARKHLPKVAQFIKGPGKQLLAKALPMIGTAVGSVIMPGAGSALGGALGGALGKALGGGQPVGGGVVGQLADQALSAAMRGGDPLAAVVNSGALGNAIGGPGGQVANQALSAMLNGKNPLASVISSGAAGNLLGSLMGGESEYGTLEEAKYDLSKRLVRTVTQAADNAIHDPRVQDKATQVVDSALKKAASVNIPPAVRAIMAAVNNAPNPMQNGGGAVHPANGQSGRWVRRGDQIILMGA